MIKTFSIIIVLISLSTTSFGADYYFSARPYKKLLDHNDNVLVKIDYLSKVDLKNYRFRPDCNFCIIQSYDFATSRWVISNSLWSELPSLSDEILLKVKVYRGVSDWVWLNIQDIKTSQTYQTPKFNVWSRSIYLDYLKSLNMRIGLANDKL